MHSSVLKKNSLQFKAASVVSLLQQLTDIQKRREQGEELTVPSVTLHLTSGRELIGYVLDLVTSESGGSVVLQTQIEQAKPRVVYTELSKIEAVGFFQKPPKPMVKSRNSNPFIERKPAVSAAPAKNDRTERPKVVAVAASELDVQKNIFALQSVFSCLMDTSLSVNVSWRGMVKDSRSLHAIKTTLNILRECFSELASASMRREGLRDNLKQIELQNSEIVDLSIESGVLIIRAPFAQGKIPYSSSQALIALIEPKLF